MTKFYEIYVCSEVEDEFGVNETEENRIYAVVESDDGEITVIPEIESTDPDHLPDLVRAARNGFSKPVSNLSARYYWANTSEIPADYFGGLPSEVIAAGLDAKAELIAEIDEDKFTLYQDDLKAAGKALFSSTNVDEPYTGLQDFGASSLYDGGWRASNREELADAFGLCDEYLDRLVEYLQKCEDEEDEDEDEEDER